MDGPFLACDRHFSTPHPMSRPTVAICALRQSPRERTTLGRDLDNVRGYASLIAPALCRPLYSSWCRSATCRFSMFLTRPVSDLSVELTSAWKRVRSSILALPLGIVFARVMLLVQRGSAHTLCNRAARVSVLCMQSVMSTGQMGRVGGPSLNGGSSEHEA